MCDKAVRDDTFSLACVPDWLVILQQVKLEDDDIVMKMRLLGGTKVIKNAWSRKQK